MSWVLVFGILAILGVFMATEDLGHRIGVWMESSFAQWVVYALGVAAMYTLAVPLLQMRADLTRVEVVVFLGGAILGIAYLAFRIQDLFEHSRGVAVGLGMVVIGLVLALWFFRPEIPTVDPVVGTIGTPGDPTMWWITPLGVLGGAGCVWWGLHSGHVAHHIGHGAGHGAGHGGGHGHGPDIGGLLRFLSLAIGFLFAAGLWWKVLNMDTTLTGPERWFHLVIGSAGLLFLLVEVGHTGFMHHRPRFSAGVTYLGLALTLALWIWRPEGVRFTGYDDAPAPRQTSGAAVRTGTTPGFGGSMGGGSTYAPAKSIPAPAKRRASATAKVVEDVPCMYIARSAGGCRPD